MSVCRFKKKGASLTLLCFILSDSNQRSFKLFACFGQRISVAAVFVVVAAVVDVAVVVVAVFPQLNSGGSPSIYNCALTNLFDRVGGLHVLY